MQSCDQLILSILKITTSPVSAVQDRFPAQYMSTAQAGSRMLGIAGLSKAEASLIIVVAKAKVIYWRCPSPEFQSFTWNEHVIKTFKAKQSPFRNCLDSAIISRIRHEQNDNETRATCWPTEIPASLIAGTVQGFLPVNDAFFARSSSEKLAQWYLVTPLMRGGTLESLAKSVSHDRLDREATV